MVTILDPSSVDLQVASPAILVPADLGLKTAPIRFSVPSPEIHTEADGIAKMTFVVPNPTIVTSDHRITPAVVTFIVPEPTVASSHFTLAPCVMRLRPIVPHRGKASRFSSLTYAPPVIFRALDIAPLNDDQGLTAGIYFSAVVSRNAEFRGAVIYESRDAGSTYELIGQMTEESIVGTLQTALASTVYGVWDRVTAIDVRLTKGTLASTTADKMVNGANWCLLGTEIIGFVNAVLIGEHTYRLSELIRGMRDTSSSTSKHFVEEDFILLLDDEGHMRVKYLDLRGAVESNKSRLYKLVSPGATLASVNAEGVHLGPRNITPFAPGNIRVHAVPLASGANVDDRWLRWRRRTRARVRTFNVGPVPMLDETESYVFSILDHKLGDTFLLKVNSRNIDDTNDMTSAFYDTIATGGEPDAPAGGPNFVITGKQMGAGGTSSNETESSELSPLES